MELSITVNLDNAAFEDNETELQDVLRQIVIYDDGLVRNLRDTNGNTVGHYVVTK